MITHLDMDNVETSVVALTVSDNTHTTHITTTSRHGDYTSVKADEVRDFACESLGQCSYTPEWTP